MYDTRELFGGRRTSGRRLWLIEHTYEASADRDELDVNIGMVGSITFCIVRRDECGAVAGRSVRYPLRIELATNGDPGAPEERTAAAGRRLLFS